MKAQPKHLSCIAVAAFHLACMQHQKLQQEQQQPNPVAVPEPLDLVNISQSRCSPSDLLRMRGILGMFDILISFGPYTNHVTIFSEF